METENFKFSGNVGDIISLIPAWNKFWVNSGKKINLFLWLDRQAHYYQGASHPVTDPYGIQCMLNRRMFDLVKPLLLQQPCINEVNIFQGEECKADFDRLYETHVNKPYGSINRWAFYVFPDLSCDVSGRWLTVPDSEEDLARGKIIITRTERYHNQLTHYFFLREYQEHLLFAGLEYEHEIFCKEFNLEMPFLKTNDFLILSQAIKQCRFFMSNQTAAFQIAEGLKVPRILELCSAFPNVVPIGEDAYDFYSQKSLEYYFNLLYRKTSAAQS